MGKKDTTPERWNSRLGAILAVAGSAVGFGNFLRFPGLAAQYGGGAFMIAYFCAFLLLGIPLCWVEWSVGRRGGALGGHSCASIFMMLARRWWWKYLGVLAVIAPMGIGMYYMYLEGWTIGYAWHTAVGELNFSKSGEFSNFFANFTGVMQDGAIFSGGSSVLPCFIIALLANFYLLYKGIAKGIEWFCKWSMPVLLATAVLILVRVLTLGTPDAAHPERSVNEGLGYMWNPSKTLLVAGAEGEKPRTLAMLPAGATEAEKAELISRTAAANPGVELREEPISLVRGLMNPELWLTAAGQIFFSLSVGFGTICTYASYVGRKEDIALSSLTANAANEVVEVGIAGMMIVPAAVSFLGVAAAAGASTFGLGFEVLPQVFAAMPGGQVFGTLFFGLLFLAAITSSISMMQPSIAFMKEFWGLSHKQSVTLVALLLTGGSGLVAWFTGDGLLALSTLDFWAGTMCVYLLAAVFIILFRFFWGTDRGLAELRRGSLIHLPKSLAFVINWVTPALFALIFGTWLYQNIFGTTCVHITNLLEGKPGAVLPMLWVGGITCFMLLVAHTSKKFHTKNAVQQKERTPDA